MNTNQRQHIVGVARAKIIQRILDAQDCIDDISTNYRGYDSLRPEEKMWLSLRVSRNWLSQLEIAQAMNVSAMTVNRIEKKMKGREDMCDFLGKMGVRWRTPRGATVTKRKKD